MKLRSGLVTVVLVAAALPAWATTFINADADSARTYTGQSTTIIPIDGSAPNAASDSPRNVVNFPNVSTNNCVVFNIPALPQTMTNAPTLNCAVTIRDIAATPNSTVGFIFAARAFPAGEVITNSSFAMASTANLSVTLLGATNNTAIVSGLSTNFPVLRNFTTACGPECRGTPAAVKICRASATGDTVQLINLTCQE